MPQSQTLTKITAELAQEFLTKLNAKALEDGFLSLETIFEHAPNSEQLILKPEFTPEWSEFIANRTSDRVSDIASDNHSNRPWYQSLLSSILNFIQNIPDYTYGISSFVVNKIMAVLDDCVNWFKNLFGFKNTDSTDSSANLYNTEEASSPPAVSGHLTGLPLSPLPPASTVSGHKAPAISPLVGPKVQRRTQISEQQSQEKLGSFELDSSEPHLITHELATPETEKDSRRSPSLTRSN